MGHDPSGPFLMSTIELKLDQYMMSKWQKYSQKSTTVPDYRDILEFLNLRAQASESTVLDSNQKKPRIDLSGKRIPSKPGAIASFTTHTEPSISASQAYIMCKPDKHPLYSCPKFRGMSHDTMVSTLKSHNPCMNCLGPNHFVKNCKSLHRCKQYQRPHHTLLHLDQIISSTPTTGIEEGEVISWHTITALKSNSLLMTCRVLVKAPDGTCVEARALLDNASSTSFVSERLSQALQLPRTNHSLRISGIAGLSRKSPLQAVTTFTIIPIHPSDKKIDVTAMVVPQVTCDLPFHPVSLQTEWNHLSNLRLTDLGFG